MTRARCPRCDARRARVLSFPTSVESLESRLFLAAQMLGDLNPAGLGSAPERLGSDAGEFTSVGAFAYFTADDGVHGRELWKADRSTGAVSLVRDLVPGPESSEPLSLRSFGGALYFFGLEDGDSGRYRLFRTDGTAAGTVAVSDDVEAVTLYNRVDLTRSGPLVASGDKLFFYGRTEESGIGVYATGGTPGDVTAVKDLAADRDPTPQEWYAYGMTDFNGQAVFTTPDGLFITDGTAGGTRLLYENVTGRNYGSTPHFEAVGDTLYFTGYPRDREVGLELMKTDGTPAGTRLVKDIWPGNRINTPFPASSEPYNLTNVGGKLFLYARTEAGCEPWRSDGTEAGTVMVKDINPSWPGSGMNYGHLPAPPEVSLATRDGVVYFRATDGDDGVKLWRSDTTEAGTRRVFGDESPFGGSGLPVFSGGTMYFAALGGLWKSDLTPEGTVRIWEGAVGPLTPTPEGGVVFMGYAGTNPPAGRGDFEPHLSDGTREGTRRLADINRDTGDSGPQSAVELSDGTVVFVAANGTHGDLYRTDGTPAGTRPLGMSGEWRWIQALTAAGDVAYFGMHHDEGYGLFKTDGTPEGTTLVKSFDVGDYEDPFRILSFTPAGGGDVYFQAHQSYGTTQLWVTDGTEAGTRLVKDLNTSALYQETPAFPALFFDGKLYFTASEPETGPELWKADGTPAGTTIVRDLLPGPEGAGAGSLFAHDGVLHFVGRSTLGPGLYRLDPALGPAFLGVGGSEDEPPLRYAAVGDRMYLAIPYNGGWRLEGTTSRWGPDGSHIVALASPDIVVYDDRLYFIAIDDEHGAELWTADRDGRARLFKDVYPGEVSGFDFAIPNDLQHQAGPPLLAVAAGKLYFVARDRDHGRHLFVTDGTPEGTRVAAVTDPRSPGVPGSMPQILLGTDDNLYFASNDYQFGRELFGLHTDETPPRVVSSAYRPGPAGMEFAVTFSEDVGPTLNTFDFRLERETPAGPEEYDTGLLHLAYDPAARTATLRLLRPVRDGAYVLSVPDGGAIADAAYNPLTPRELLRFVQAALAGDATGDGRVDALDVADVKRRLGTTAGQPRYAAPADVNADGRINALDLAAVKRRLGTRAPAVVVAAAPVAPPPPPDNVAAAVSPADELFASAPLLS